MRAQLRLVKPAPAEHPGPTIAGLDIIFVKRPMSGRIPVGIQRTERSLKLEAKDLYSAIATRVMEMLPGETAQSFNQRFLGPMREGNIHGDQILAELIRREESGEHDASELEIDGLIVAAAYCIHILVSPDAEIDRYGWSYLVDASFIFGRLTAKNSEATADNLSPAARAGIPVEMHETLIAEYKETRNATHCARLAGVTRQAFDKFLKKQDLK